MVAKYNVGSIFKYDDKLFTITKVFYGLCSISLVRGYVYSFKRHSDGIICDGIPEFFINEAMTIVNDFNNIKLDW